MKRRSFLKSAATASAGLYIVPAHVLGGIHRAPSDTLYVAAIGVGGRGANLVSDMKRTGKVRFVAFSDVDDQRASEVYKDFKKVPRYRDFRALYDNHLKDVDAFCVGTPDHTHASIAVPFMLEGKHAYVEKPLTHNIREARLMAKIAADKQLVTQMGNQGSSGAGIQLAREIVESGILGKVNRVDSWTNRPVWPQGFMAYKEAQPVPETLSWDLWLGPAPEMDYNPGYLPFKWRGWWNFGTGALGDMGCHILESPFYALQLDVPDMVSASCTTNWIGDFVESDFQGACPSSSIVRFGFTGPDKEGIQVNWYDGGLMPPYPDGLQPDETIGGSGGGSVFYGSDAIMVTDTYSANPRILKASGRSTPKLKKAFKEEGHMENWVNACLQGGKTNSPFDYASKLTETVLIGNLALRAFQYKELKPGKKPTDWAPFDFPGRKPLVWDKNRMVLDGFDPALPWIRGEYRKGWDLRY